jgi:Tfp pilus assembly protein PilN
MRRFNFLPSRGDTHVARWLERVPLLEPSPRTQNAFLACAFTAVCCSCLSLWENTQLRISQMQYARSVVHLEQTERQLGQIQALTTTIERLGNNARLVSSIRGGLAQRLQNFADIGDHLPDRVWLTAVQDDGIHMHIRGRAISAADIGTTLTQIEHLPGIEETHLNELHTSQLRGLRAVEFDLLFKERHT